MMKQIWSAEPLPESIDYDARLIKDWLPEWNEYWICIQYRAWKNNKQQAETNLDKQEIQNKIAAIDPGVRENLCNNLW